ncbi:MAG: hypothetical protein IT236_08660, partial [Bacteroidia bacterium]|nr:hypothetical protein [Bacteroidia bacterium]
MTGNSTSKAINRPKSVKTKTESGNSETQDKEKKGKPAKASSTKFVDLALPANEIDSLTEFFQEKKPQTQNEKIAVVMKWYKDHINNSEISLPEINYLMSICSKV